MESALTRFPPHPILRAVAWTTALILTALLTGLILAVVRSVKRRRRRLIYLIPVGVYILMVRWAGYRQAWGELAVATAASALICLVWWFSYGRRLPPPSDDNIRVWTKDDPF